MLKPIIVKHGTVGKSSDFSCVPGNAGYLGKINSAFRLFNIDGQGVQSRRYIQLFDHIITIGGYSPS